MESPPQGPLEPDVVGRNLAYARRRAGLTLTELARRAQVPISTLSNVERGRRKGDDLRTGAARRVCDVLEVSLDWLTGRYTHGSSSPAPPGQETAEMTEPEREASILRLIAEDLHRPRVPRPPDLESIDEDDP